MPPSPVERGPPPTSQVKGSKGEEQKRPPPPTISGDADDPMGPPPKKAKPFEFEQFIKFFDHVDLNDRFQLVRAAAAVLLYFGANRVAEIKEVKFGGKKL